MQYLYNSTWNNYQQPTMQKQTLNEFAILTFLKYWISVCTKDWLTLKHKLEKMSLKIIIMSVAETPLHLISIYICSAPALWSVAAGQREQIVIFPSCCVQTFSPKNVRGRHSTFEWYGEESHSQQKPSPSCCCWQKSSGIDLNDLISSFPSTFIMLSPRSLCVSHWHCQH